MTYYRYLDKQNKFRLRPDRLRIFSAHFCNNFNLAPWILWFDDLSQPATMFEIFGFPFRLLPLIMAGSMYLQQKMMPQTGMDPVQARMMLIMMPGMMLLFSYTFPSGLVLYWTVSNILGIAHQYWVRNHLQKA